MTTFAGYEVTSFIFIVVRCFVRHKRPGIYVVVRSPISLRQVDHDFGQFKQLRLLKTLLFV